MNRRLYRHRRSNTASRRRVLFGAVMLFFAAITTAMGEPKRILVLHSVGRDFSPWAELARSFRAEVDQKSLEPIDFYEASLSSERLSANKDEGALSNYLQALFAERRLDLVVSIGAPAATFLQSNRPTLFPSVPMLLTGVEQRRVSFGKLTANDTVVAFSNDIAGVVKNILSVLPDTRTVAVVVGNSPLENYWMQQAQEAVAPLTNRVAFTWFNDLPFEQMLKRAAELPPKSAIFFLSLWVDAAGVSHEEVKSLRRLRAVANAPMFSYLDAYLGDVIVGGPLLSMDDWGAKTADVAMRILGGEMPGDIKTPPLVFGTPKFDWRELQRWNISESHLPPGSEVYFRTPSVWEQYRWQIWSALAIVLVQALLICWLVFERERRKRASEQMGRARIETGQYRESLAHLVRVHTVGEMSTAIAHEINQPLVAIKNYALAARRRLAGIADSAKVEELLDKIGAQASRAGDVLHTLRTMVKKHESEVTRIEIGQLVTEALKLVEIESRSASVHFECVVSPDLPPVFADGIQIQQVVLNLTRNAIEAIEEAGIPGGAVRIDVSNTENNEVAVSVTDNGPGIPAKDAKHIFEPFYSTKGAGGLGVGLSISRAIIEGHGGLLSLTPNRGGGCIFRFTLPVDRGKLTA